ncbi:MAG TPA: hypothetical protein VLB83_04295 [Candidatus Paceibacterota bacterium]|nr:hypothetical protein [Candidatus Paceibacterota bacterium]
MILARLKRDHWSFLMGKHFQGIPPSFEIVLAWFPMVHGVVGSLQASMRIRGTDDTYFETCASTRSAAALLDDIEKGDPDGLIRIAEHVLVRKAVIRSVRADEWIMQPVLQFNWGPFSDVVVFPGHRARDLALERYGIFSFISEDEVHGERARRAKRRASS